MRIAITGCRGQLGRELISAMAHPALETFCTDIEEMDITSAEQIDAVLSKYKPHAIINAAAYTQVDAAEVDRDLAYAVNATAPGLLAEWCHRSGAFLVHVSTDYVFNGRKGSAYVETDATDPLSVYGATKAQGETAVRESLPKHLIVRTSWLYSIHGQNFVKTILKLCRKKNELQIVTDQYGSPTSAADLAGAIWAMVARIEKHPNGPWGTYHFCCKGVVSWYDFAAEIVRLMPELPGDPQIRINPIPTVDYPTAAERPAYSALDCSKFEAIFGYSPPEWRESLRAVIASLTAGSI